MARPAHHQESHVSGHIPPAQPGADLREGIGANQKVECITLGKRSADLLDGIDGVTARGIFFQPRNLKTGLLRTGKFQHAQAVSVRGMGDTGLMRGMGGGNKQDTVQLKAFGGLPGQCNMPEVHGIESAAEDR